MVRFFWILFYLFYCGFSFGLMYAFWVRHFRTLNSYGKMWGDWWATLGLSLFGPISFFCTLVHLYSHEIGARHGILFFPPRKIYQFCNFKTKCKQCKHKIFCLINMQDVKTQEWKDDQAWVEHCLQQNHSLLLLEENKRLKKLLGV